MRINKYLALKNYSTRRGADELIKKHKVFINGELAQLGDKITESDVVEVKGNKKPSSFMYYAYNKPVGIVTLAPQAGEKGIENISGLKGVFPVGRLDKNSEGLIILTNDGRITDRLLNPKHSHEKEYVVETKEKLRNNFKEKMEAGVNIEGYVTEKCQVDIKGEKKFSIILNEGKRHQIRRMCAALFNEVKTLKRIRVMNIKLGNLPKNGYRKIEGKELDIFLRGLGL